MAQNFSQLAILEGNDNYVPIRLKGQIINVPTSFFATKLYNVKDVLNHENVNLLNGIADHFEREGLMIGNDGFIYASRNPYDQTLSGDDYEPIAILDGDDLTLAGFKFKMPSFKAPKFKMPKAKMNFKAPKIKVKAPKLTSLKNPLKGISKGVSSVTKGISKGISQHGKNLSKAASSYGKHMSSMAKGIGKGLSSIAKGAGEFAEQLLQSQAPQEEPTEEEQPTEESVEESYEEQPEEENYSDETTEESYEEQPEEENYDYPVEEMGSFAMLNTALSAANTKGAPGLQSMATGALDMYMPGAGTAANLAIGIAGKAAAQKKAKKEAQKKQQLALLQTLIKKNPTKPVIVKKPVAKKQIPLPPRPNAKQSFSAQRGDVVPGAETGSTTKSSNTTLLIGLGIAAALALSGSQKD